jgi:type IV pilus assembly protein PilM
VALSQRLGWVGVDIGTHAVKLAQAVRTAGGMRLHRSTVIQRTSDWTGNDALGRDQPLTSRDEIRAALEIGGFSGRNAICAPPMNVCELRGLNIPPGSDRERRSIIGDELSDEWAERRTQMDFDFWELESGKAEKGTDMFNVNVLATSRPWVLQLAHDCQQAGLDCWAVDGVPLALARAVGLVGGASGGRRVLAVDWGFSNTTLCIVGDDRPLYARRVHDCAFGKVLDSIMHVLGVTMDEAQYLVDSVGITAPTVVSPEHAMTSGKEVPKSATVDRRTQVAMSDAAEEALEELVRQIGRTLHFTDSQRRHLQPAAIWLLGGGASMGNIGPHLEQALRLPVHIWNISGANDEMPWAAGGRAAVFGEAVALSALAWAS